MKIGLAVHGNPGSDQGADSALQFAAAAVARGHRIPCVFFYLDGVLHASAMQVAPDRAAEWRSLAAAHGIELVVCVAAAERRGMLDADAASRHGRAAANVAHGFTLAGLGQLITCITSVDRFVTFGP